MVDGLHDSAQAMVTDESGRLPSWDWMTETNCAVNPFEVGLEATGNDSLVSGLVSRWDSGGPFAWQWIEGRGLQTVESFARQEMGEDCRPCAFRMDSKIRPTVTIRMCQTS